jgi:hypothetical protein
VSGHAKYSPSSAERWHRCPGSVRLIERAPPQPESVYALEGTQAHQCLEAFLLGGPAAWGTVKAELLKANPMTMVNHAWTAAQLIWQDAGGEPVLAEAKVVLIPGKVYGTLDAAVVDELLGLLRIYDLKFGAGIAVEVKENLQLICYALAKAREYPAGTFTHVEMVVLQPRAEHPGGPTRRWRITFDELEAYLPQFDAALARCEAQVEGLEDLHDGPHCKFCPAKVICPAIGERAMVAAEASFKRLDTVPAVVPITLPPADGLKDLGTALKACDALEDWIDAVRTYALDRMKAGDAVPGFKLVAKRAQRRWKDEMEACCDAAETFGDNAFVSKLLSPAQLESQFKAKDWVAERTVSESSGVTIAAESDKRPATQAVAHTFETLE